MAEIVVATTLAVALAIFLASFFRKRPTFETSRTTASPSKTCPLCGESLTKTEKVHSVVYATKTRDKIMEISGCPHCRPDTNGSRRVRICPVCKKPLRPQDVVTARAFERNDGRKTHVHVLGCPRCRERG